MRLKELRISNDLTQTELAKILGITQFTYSNYEQEKTQPPIELLQDISNYYNVSLDYLCGHETKHLIDTSNLSKEVIDTIKIVLSLPLPKLYKLNGYALRLSQEI